MFLKSKQIYIHFSSIFNTIPKGGITTLVITKNALYHIQGAIVCYSRTEVLGKLKLWAGGNAPETLVTIIIPHSYIDSCPQGFILSSQVSAYCLLLPMPEPHHFAGTAAAL
jgi:hypothetical protein